jgi:hypothetical protein
MADDDMLQCEKHGSQRVTYVCQHITNAPQGESVGFVSGAPEDEHDLRDAWCDDCHSYLLAHGGHWTDELEVPGGIGLLCSQCYRSREADAVKSGRRLIYDR